MIVDGHHHVWRVGAAGLDWLTPADGALYRDFALSDLMPELAAASIDATVVVQAANTEAETRMLLACAAASTVVAGVVGWIPLHRAKEALDELGSAPALKGIRHLMTYEDPRWLVRPGVLDGLAVIAERDLVLDVPATLPSHLEDVVTVATRLPHLRIVIDHLGKPPIASARWEPWATLFAAAASLPNVTAKLSGLGTSDAGSLWDPTLFRPYVAYALECFGPRRLIGGSDWPVSLLAADFQTVWRGTRGLVEQLDPDDRDAVLGGAAADVYDLDPPLRDSSGLDSDAWETYTSQNPSETDFGTTKEGS